MKVHTYIHLTISWYMVMKWPKVRHMRMCIRECENKSDGQMFIEENKCGNVPINPKNVKNILKDAFSSRRLKWTIPSTRHHHFMKCEESSKARALELLRTSRKRPRIDGVVVNRRGLCLKARGPYNV